MIDDLCTFNEPLSWRYSSMYRDGTVIVMTTVRDVHCGWGVGRAHITARAHQPLERFLQLFLHSRGSCGQEVRVSLRHKKWTWPRGEPQFCMAEHEEAAAGVLLGMNEGGDPLGTPGNNFEHDISPGPSPALSGGQAGSSTEIHRADRE